MKSVALYRPRVFDNVLNQFDSYIDSFFRDNFRSNSERMFSRLPPVDVRETESNYVIEAELAGFDQKDIQIRLDGNTLTIESRQEEAKGDENAEKAASASSSYLIRERAVAAFSRSFKLPENINAEEISASFKNGVLSLEIAKKPEAQQKVIQISAA